jgi:SAM-dependent methyltransferase
MKLSARDRLGLRGRYRDQYARFGYSPKALGWDKGKQQVRFDVLTSPFDIEGKSVLDVGCGFGDLNQVLQTKARRYRYLGVDVTEELLKEARVRYRGRGIRFRPGDFLDLNLRSRFDIVIGSGIFNLALASGRNDAFIRSTLAKAFELCREGIAFDFLSDKVAYRYRDTFHASPEQVLTLAYALSRNVLLRNDYMPFEFSVFVFKDDSFDTADTLFRKFKKGRPEDLPRG